MATGDNRQIAYPNNSLRQDWDFYRYTGGLGGGGLVVSGTSRYSFWLDLDPFNVKLRDLYCTNWSFQIFEDPDGIIPLNPAIIQTAYNDFTDELVESYTSTMSPGDSIAFGDPTGGSANLYLPTSQPPYSTFTGFLPGEPGVSNNYWLDQGGWTYNAETKVGAFLPSGQMLGQGFYANQPQLTAFGFYGVVNDGITTNPSQYTSVTFELWDFNQNFVAHLGTIQPQYDTNNPNGPLTMDDGFSISFDASKSTTATATDGVTYWTGLKEFIVFLGKPIDTTPGSIYYIFMRETNTALSGVYGLGINVDNSSVRDPLYYYPFATCVLTADGSNSGWTDLTDANGNYANFAFRTYGNVARFGTHFWWANIGNGASNYWFGTQSSAEFVYTHVDYNSRI